MCRFLLEIFLVIVLASMLVYLSNASSLPSAQSLSNGLEDLTAKKRFYSWEEGKRSSSNGQRSLVGFEEDDPWKRTLYAWRSAKGAPRTSSFLSDSAHEYRLLKRLSQRPFTTNDADI